MIVYLLKNTMTYLRIRLHGIQDEYSRNTACLRINIYLKLNLYIYI